MSVDNSSPVRSISLCGQHSVGTKRPIWDEAAQTQSFEYEWPCGCCLVIDDEGQHEYNHDVNNRPEEMSVEEAEIRDNVRKFGHA